jgi:hypothetical protein
MELISFTYTNIGEMRNPMDDVLNAECPSSSLKTYLKFAQS